MPPAIPASRPRLAPAVARELARHAAAVAPKTGPHALDSAALASGLLGSAFRGVVLLFVRGYYRDSMGAPGRNDRGIYDDALVALAVDGRDVDAFTAFNGNVDSTRTGLRPDGRKGLAQLVETSKGGVYRYQLGTHTPTKPNRRAAFVQHGPITIDRDGPNGVEAGFFGVNVHDALGNTTGSEGCPTLPTLQMRELLAFARRWMHDLGNPVAQLVLVTEQERAAWSVQPVISP